jgi:flagellar FliL protein
MRPNLTRIILLPLLLAFSLTTPYASELEAAKEGGGGGYARLEPITVNLTELDRYLQVQITAKTGSPEIEEAIKMYMPVIRHELILLLSSKSAGDVTTPAGKQKLMEESKVAINKAAGLNLAHGVAAVLFESFIVQ